MNRDIGILTLASTIRDLVEARDEASAKVAEIDAVLDDCRRALGTATSDELVGDASVTIAGVKVEDIAVALAAGARRCKCGKVFTPGAGPAATVCSRACYEHQAAVKRAAAKKPAPARQAPVTATIAKPTKATTGRPLCACGCGQVLPPQLPGRGRRRQFVDLTHSKRKQRARRKVDVDVPVVLRAKHLPTHEVVFSGRGFKDGRGLSSAVGHSSLHAETVARGVRL